MKNPFKSYWAWSGAIIGMGIAWMIPIPQKGAYILYNSLQLMSFIRFPGLSLEGWLNIAVASLIGLAVGFFLGWGIQRTLKK